ncbi:MAG: sulfatase-like hydrolase/transferase [Vicinamibacterales bacterium]
MRRRSVFEPVALTAPLFMAVAIVAAWWWPRTPTFAIAPNADRNVLLVTVDTLRADALGSYGGRALTPNLDRLASTGARFDFAHAHAVTTLASHASILGGRYPYQHGIRDNTGYRYPADQPTLATLLGHAGFATAAFVGGFPLDKRFGLGIGFGAYDDRLTPASGRETADGERRADVVVQSALDWIGRQGGKWFSWVHVYDPHAPYSAPQEWAARFPSDPYLGEVSWTDHALSGLFDRLASEDRPTLVVVTADHGESLGEHGELTHSLFAYESTLRVPLIIAEVRPGKGLMRGASIPVPVRHVDLLPTVLESLGVSPPTGLPGASLRGVIAGRDGSDRPSYFEAMTAAVTRGWAPLRGVIVARDKFIDLPIAELYDLAADRKEATNLAAVQGSRADLLFGMLRQFNVAPPTRAQAETTDTLERLRSLGYIGGGGAAVKERYTEADDPKRLIELEHTLQRASEAFTQGRPAEAIDLYGTVIKRRPDTEDAYRKLALVYWRTGRPEKAIATLESALLAGVTQSEVRIRLGQYLAQSGQPSKAIALLENDARDDPDALIALGNSYSLAGRHREAAKTFQHLLALDPGNALAHENIGTAQLQARDLVSAEQSLRRAIELDPRLAGAYTALGVLLANTGRHTEAIEAWTKALQLDPADANARHNLKAVGRAPGDQL